MEKALRSGCAKKALAVPLLLLLLLLVILQQAVGLQGIPVWPRPGSVKIQDFSYWGGGCLPGSTEGVLSHDARVLTVNISRFIARTDKSLRERKRSCVVAVGLSYPHGWVLTAASVTHRGFAILEHGTSGFIETSYYFSGQPGTSRSNRKIRAPFKNNFEYTDKFLTALYSKCAVVSNLNLLSTIRVDHDSRKGKAIIYNAVGQEWQLVWKWCLGLPVSVKGDK